MANQSETILTALHYLFSHDANKVVAHCLDLDLVTSGPSIEQAELRLNGIVLAQIGQCFTSGNFAQLRFKAPGEYWEALSSARELGRVHLDVEVPPIVLPVRRSVVSLPVYRSEALAVAAQIPSMRLHEVLTRLAAHGFGKVGTWEVQGRKGITLGDPSKFFPNPTGPRYPIDTTNDQDPELTDEEIRAVERRFGVTLI